MGGGRQRARHSARRSRCAFARWPPEVALYAPAQADPDFCFITEKLRFKIASAQLFYFFYFFIFSIFIYDYQSGFQLMRILIGGRVFTRQFHVEVACFYLSF